MNIQLFLDKQEVDLGQNVTIPMNKTYSNLFSPSEIIIDYSKEIQIPATQNNNKILGNAYRLDRRIVEGDNNIGYHLDPSKRIPAKLIYNGKTVLDGYAKFVSASYSSTSKYYNLNLFGAIGDVIKKLMSVVTSSSLLTDDLSTDYILNDNLSGKYLDSEYVYNSWMNENNKTGSNATDYDIVGFAPSHRGFYSDFSSDKVETKDYLLTGEHSIKPISEVLEYNWKLLLNDNNYDAAEIVGDGFQDYRIRDFRAYMMKPYIYINQLFRMYQNQCRKLSDYKITLDEDWFNDANPYWSKMCYMLDYLDSKGSNTDSTTTLLSGKATPSYATTSSNYSYAKWYLSEVIDISKIVGINIATKPINITLEGNHTSSTAGELKLSDDSIIKINAQLVTGSNGDTTNFYYWSGANTTAPGGNYTDSNYIPRGISQTVNRTNYKTTYNITIPGIGLDDALDDYVAIFIHVDVENNKNGGGLWQFNSTLIQPTNGSSRFTMSAKVDGINSWRNSTKVKLSELYFSEEPLFKALIQYTKMFGLLWDVDYETKTINILHRSKYFKNYKIESWNNIIDRSKDLIIEPNTIGSKYIKFNYEEVDGYRYTGYRDKYGIGYGEKLLSSKYEFNTDTKNLFEEIKPSTSSNKSYVPISNILFWNGKSILIETIEEAKLIDAESEDGESSISINNWYLRGANTILGWRAIISNDSSLMLTSNEPCYYLDTSINPKNKIAYTMPTFDVAIQHNDVYYGCLFGTPKEDYTNDKLPTKAKNKYIYDLFWKNYISEMYGHNKKVTAYFFIDPNKYQQFKFNTLIELDNQLFLVNKISDFDINSSSSTKCELVQINNVENLYNSYTFEGGENPSIPDDPNNPSTPDEPEEDIYYDVISNAQNCELRHDSTVKKGSTFTCTVIPSNGGSIDTTQTYVTMNGIQLGSSVINTNTNKITISNVDGDINLTVVCTEAPVYYTATGTGNGCTLDYSRSVLKGSTFICTITPFYVDGEIDWDNTSIHMGDHYLIPSEYIDTNLNSLIIDNVDGDIEFVISYTTVEGGEVNPTPRPDDPDNPDTPVDPDEVLPEGTYTVSVTNKGCKVGTYPTTITHGESLSFTVTTTISGGTVDNELSYVIMGGVQHHILDYLLGTRIFIPEVTGDVVINLIYKVGEIIDTPERE